MEAKYKAFKKQLGELCDLQLDQLLLVEVGGAMVRVSSLCSDNHRGNISFKAVKQKILLSNFCLLSIKRVGHLLQLYIFLAGYHFLFSQNFLCLSSGPNFI